MQVSTDNTKRRRTSSSHDGTSILSLSTLPGDHLTTVSSYLAPTSKLLLACALSAPSTSFGTVNWKGDESLTNESKAILTSMVSTIEELDFGDVGELAGKLSDDDIAAVLVCIDAKNKLKKLLLNGCNRIIGHGLECLRESSVLEHISLHLPMESLSWELISSIVDSIVDNDGSSLHEIKASNMKYAKNDLAVKQFLRKFHDMLLSGDKCEACVPLEVGEDHEVFVSTASKTCFECFKGVCGTCDNYSDYSIRKCSHCDLTFCENHGSDEGPCYSCDKFYCSACADIDIVGAAKTCDGGRCNYAFCVNCSQNCYCDGCRGVHFNTLFARDKKHKKENSKLNKQVTRLHIINEELRKEIEELQKKMSSGLGILS